MEVDCAVCYVSDLNFVLPTLVSAVRLRTFVDRAKARVFIFAVDAEEAFVEAANLILKAYAIELIPMSSHSFTCFDHRKFNKTHVSHATLGRFFMDDALPASCRRIVYIDGDTWACQDISALIDRVVPEGNFAASEDVMSFRRSKFTKQGREISDYHRALGLEPKNGYFNCGVFAVSRKTWRTLANEAFEFFLKHTELCRYHDQSALNAVVGDRRLSLSMKWNFQTSYRYLNLDRRITPYIYHFTQYPKIWMGNCKPWTELYEVYQDSLDAFTHLHLPLVRLSPEDIQAHNVHVEKKFAVFQFPIFTDLYTLMAGYDKFEAQTWF